MRFGWQPPPETASVWRRFKEGRDPPDTEDRARRRLRPQSHAARGHTWVLAGFARAEPTHASLIWLFILAVGCAVTRQ